MWVAPHGTCWNAHVWRKRLSSWLAVCEMVRHSFGVENVGPGRRLDTADPEDRLDLTPWTTCQATSADGYL